nr:6561_t:CDS:2 [Entrophospora candida]
MVRIPIDHSFTEKSWTNIGKRLVKNRVDAYDDTINNNKSSIDPINILDAINFCGEAWDAVSQSVNCWKKTKILPDYDLNTIHELQEEINNDEIIREEIDELQEEINKLYFSEPISAMEFANIDNEVSEEFSDAEIIETVCPSQNNEVAEDEDEGIELEPSIPVKNALEYSENILSFLKNPPLNFLTT